MPGAQLSAGATRRTEKELYWGPYRLVGKGTSHERCSHLPHKYIQVQWDSFYWGKPKKCYFLGSVVWVGPGRPSWSCPGGGRCRDGGWVWTLRLGNLPPASAGEYLVALASYLARSKVETRISVPQGFCEKNTRESVRLIETYQCVILQSPGILSSSLYTGNYKIAATPRIRGSFTCSDLICIFVFRSSKFGSSSALQTQLVGTLTQLFRSVPLTTGRENSVSSFSNSKPEMNHVKLSVIMFTLYNSNNKACGWQFRLSREPEFRGPHSVLSASWHGGHCDLICSGGGGEALRTEWHGLLAPIQDLSLLIAHAFLSPCLQILVFFPGLFAFILSPSFSL